MLNQPGLRALNLQKVRLLERLAAVKPELANAIRSTQLDWYRIKNAEPTTDFEELDPTTEIDTPAAEVFIYDEIGGSFGVNVSQFINELNEIDSPTITVRINSPGGLLIDAIAIASALEQHPSQIITRVDGIAASAASLIAVAGDKCEMMNGAQLMIHRVSCGTQGNVDDYAETMAWLREQDDNVANMYGKRTNSDPEEWLARMKAETWMFADEAVELGLMDSVYTRLKQGLDPVKEEPEEEPEEEPADGEEPEEEPDEEEVMNSLLTRPHRLTNRGFKYLGRNKAPAPTRANNNFADLVDMWR